MTDCKEQGTGKTFYPIVPFNCILLSRENIGELDSIFQLQKSLNKLLTAQPQSSSSWTWNTLSVYPDQIFSPWVCDNLDLKGSFWLGLSEASQSKISRESWLSSFKSGSAFRVWASSAQLGKSKFWFPICAWCSFIWSHQNLIKILDVTSRFSASRILKKKISHYAHYDILDFRNKIDIAALWLSRNLFSEDHWCERRELHIWIFSLWSFSPFPRSGSRM